MVYDICHMINVFFFSQRELYVYSILNLYKYDLSFPQYTVSTNTWYIHYTFTINLHRHFVLSLNCHMIRHIFHTFCVSIQANTYCILRIEHLCVIHFLWSLNCVFYQIYWYCLRKTLRVFPNHYCGRSGCTR